MTPTTREIVKVAWGGVHKRLRPVSEIQSGLKCDGCGDPIEAIEDAWLEWLRGTADSMRLVHHRNVTGTAEKPDGCCYLETTARMQDHHLFRFAAADGPSLLRALRHEGSGKIMTLLYGEGAR